MSGILLAGMVDKEAAAIEIMVGMYWRDRPCVTLGRSPALCVPQWPSQECAACELCVVDLFGLGMRRHSQEHEQRLLEFLGGRLAVLLVRGLESGWMERDLPLATSQRVQCLATPYNAHSLRETITQLLRTQAALQGTMLHVPARAPSMHSPANGPNSPALLPAWRRAEEFAKTRLPIGSRLSAPAAAPMQTPSAAIGRSRQHSPLAVPDTAALHPDRKTSERAPLAPPTLRQQGGGVGLGRGAMNALLAMFPALRSLPVMALALKIATSEGPQLLRLPPDTEMVLNFRQGWLICSLSVPELRKLAAALTPALASSTHIVQLPEQYVENLVRQRFNGRFQRVQMALDEVTWHVFGDALQGQTLVPAGDMRIQLRRFPNITALGDATSLDVQLATICACAPHCVSDLLRAFPQHEQALLRFVVRATASGLMSVLADNPPNAQSQPVPAPVSLPEKFLDPAPQVRAQRGFFKSLLEKLF